MSTTRHPDAPRKVDPSYRRSNAPLPLATLMGLVIAGIAALLIAFVSIQSSESRAATSRLLTRTLEAIEQLQMVL